MKIKSLWTLISFLTILAFVGCDDDLNSVGSNIQPPSDSIYVTTDTIILKARTVPVDSVYARTINGVLGKYQDDIFGTIKSDYLCQFYYSDSTKFKDNLQSIDSVKFGIDFALFSGDSLAPMGLSVYEVTKKLPDNFYTNVDPSPYIGSSPKLLTNSAYTVNGAKKVAKYQTGYPQRVIYSDLGIQFGQRILNYYNDPTIKKNKDTFNEMFKGAYVTTTFGSGTLINILYTSIEIYYSWKDIKGNHDNTQDTIRSTLFTLSATPEVIQLNHVQNENPQNLFTEGTGQTYMKTPAGVFTEIVIPIKEISEHMQAPTVDYKTVTSAQFSLKGYTEKEPSKPFSLQRPGNVLLIDKDSVQTFFSRRQLPDGKSSIYTSRNTTYNTYDFSNISALVNHYREKNVDNATFLVIPVDVTKESSSSSTVVGVYNYLKPSTSILRSDATNMRMELIYSRFNNTK